MDKNIKPFDSKLDHQKRIVIYSTYFSEFEMRDVFCANITSLERAKEIASQLNETIRQYEKIVKNDKSIKRKGLKPGDKVEITGNIGRLLENKKRPIIGTVISVNGFYVVVKPKHQRWEGEWYMNEIKPVKETLCRKYRSCKSPKKCKPHCRNKELHNCYQETKLKIK